MDAEGFKFVGEGDDATVDSEGRFHFPPLQSLSYTHMETDGIYLMDDGA